MKLLPFVAVLVLIGGCAQREAVTNSDAPAPTVNGRQTYESAKDKFSIQLPRNMTPLDPTSAVFKEMMRKAASVNPQLSDQIAKIMDNPRYSLYAMDVRMMETKMAFVDNVNVIHGASPGPAINSKTVEEIKKAIGKQVPGAVIKSGEIVDLPLGKAIRIVSEIPVHNTDRYGVVARSEAYFFGDDRQFYTVTFSSGSDARSAEFRESIETFKILK